MLIQCAFVQAKAKPILFARARIIIRSNILSMHCLKIMNVQTNACFVSESGLDPAEWGAKLEDRFYNNHSFKV